MKTRFRLSTIILSAAITLCSCEDMNLNLSPTFLTYSGKGEATVIRGQLATAYNMMISRDGIFAEPYWGTIGYCDTDEGFRNGVSNNTSVLNAHNINTGTSQLTRLWQKVWQGNECATNILSMLETVENMDETEIKETRGEALVLQAFYHYFAATNWGPVPIKNVATFDIPAGKTELERKPVKEVLQFALDNCREAVNLLPEINKHSTTARISKSAAEALSYRIALYMASHPDIQDTEKYNQIVEWADQFIANSPNKLNTLPITVNGEELPAYARLFVNNMANNQDWDATQNPEGIWDAVFYCKSQTSGTYANLDYEAVMRLGRDMGVPCADDQFSSSIGYADVTYRASNNLYNNYTDFNHGQDYPIGDLRRDWNIPTFCYKYKSSQATAPGHTVTTRFKYFDIILPENVTCKKEAVVLPVFDKESWGGSNNNAAATGFYVEDGGEGYVMTDEEGQEHATFGITIEKTASNFTSMAFYDGTGAIIGYNVGYSEDSNAPGYQNINFKNTSANVTIVVENGKIDRLEPDASATNVGNFLCVNGRGIGKWRREYEVDVPPEREKDYTSCNFPILRFADVLLMAAEAHLMASNGDKQKGLEYLNMVRRRAYGKDINAADPYVDFGKLTLEIIQDERMRELCFEGVRRNDLLRWGLYTIEDPERNAITRFLEENPDHIDINYPIKQLQLQFAKYETLPIPSQEISSAPNTMWQNPGW